MKMIRNCVATLALLVSFSFSLGFSAVTEEPATPVTEEPQEQQENPKAVSFEGLFLKTVFLLIGCTGVVLGGGWLLKRFGGGRFDSFSKEGAIRLVERKYLSPKTSVWLVEVKNESFVVVDSQSGVALQKAKTSPETPPSESNPV